MTTDPSPKLPLWVFVVSDVALMATAWLIAEYSHRPLSPAAITAVAGCAALGTLALLVPLLLRYERQKNEVLDDRQRALEGIARTVHDSAEQLSIAANGLNQVSDLARQSLQAAEKLPGKLQEKISAFEAQVGQAHQSDRARLEKELNTLRTASTEQTTALVAQIAVTTGEWSKLESASRQQLASANEAIAKLDQQTATKIAAAHAQALVELDARLTSLADRITALAAAATVPTAPTTQPITAPVAEPAAPLPVPEPAAAIAAPAAGETSVAVTETAPSGETEIAPPPPAPKKPRKPRRESTPAPASTESTPVISTATVAEPAAPETPPAAGPNSESPSSASPVSSEPSAEAAAADPVPATEPAPTPAPVAAEATPSPTAAVAAEIAPTTTAPAVDSTVSTPARESATPETAAVAASTAPIATETGIAPVEAPRRRATRTKPEPTPEPMLDLVIDDSLPPPRAIERGLSSDGATRMIVTAYIGIGNRLFIRGEGPGLSPDKGVPLQFISIGKWRWETNDATAAIRFRILKNDAIECTGLGEQTLEPGYQAEFGANF